MTESKRYVFVIDPPWDADAGGGGRGAGNHYALSGVDALARSYVNTPHWFSLAKREDALVFMWATAGAMAQGPSDIPDAYVLARLIGVRVCAICIWCKVDYLDEPAIEETITGPLRGVEIPWRVTAALVDKAAVMAPARMGLGQWSRVEHEYLLICRRCDVSVPDPAVRPRSVIYAERGAHSEKPERAWEQVIEPVSRSSMPGVVGVEFNARRQRKGWAAYGALDGEDKPLRFASAT